ncbi:MAG: SMC-Scp complex subunit ScpB [Alphaproteobacteria bacterium]
MDRFQQMRIIEAILFASAEPVSEASLLARLPSETDIAGILSDLQAFYGNRGINLVRVDKAWAFRTATDLAEHLRVETAVVRKMSRAAVETLAIVAYHQPVTRAEIEEIRGVALSKGTIDILLEAGWIRPRGRRRSPGRPVTWGTTPGFLDHFGLESLDALPGVDELKAAGLLDRRTGLGGPFSPSEESEEEDPIEDDGQGVLFEDEEDEAPDDGAALDALERSYKLKD